MDEVGDGLFVGTFTDASDAECLAEHGIELLVSLTHARPNGDSLSTVRTHPMTDGPQNERSAFEAAVGSVRAGLDAETTLLVHCQSGASRSPAVAATALALERESDLETAFRRVAERRDAVDPHPALVRQAARVYTASRS